GDDDEPRHNVGEDGADDDVHARGLVVLDRYALIHNRGLQVELHPRSDGGADHADGHIEIRLVAPGAGRRQLDGLDHGQVPVGAAEHPGYDVGEVEEAGGK